VFNDHSIEEIRPQRSRVTVMQILRTIERMNHELQADAPVRTNSDQLNTALQKAYQLAKHDTLVVVISDGQGADDETTRLTVQLAEHNDILGLLLYDPLRASPKPGAGGGVVTDGKMQMELDFGDERLWEHIAADYRHEMDDIRATLRKMSAPLLPISTAEDVVTQIRKLIGTSSRGIKLRRV
jgi:Mg-chelatase subunit ChlD